MTKNINGIDVSESVSTATNNDVYYSQKVVNELQNNIKRLQQELDIKEKMLDKFMIGSGEILEKLQEENKRLQMLSCANCGEKYLSPDGAELYEKNVQLQKENEELKAENEQLKKPCLVIPKVNQLAVPIEEYEKLYKALEEIRSYCDEQNLKADYTACYITNKIDEILNGRD